MPPVDATPRTEKSLLRKGFSLGVASTLLVLLLLLCLGVTATGVMLLFNALTRGASGQ